MYMGYLLPTISILREKLVAKKASVILTIPLLVSLIEGIDNRFASIWEDVDAIAAAIIHPKFKTSWTSDQNVTEKGIKHIKQLLVAGRSDESTTTAATSESEKVYFSVK
jgi:hypothetical protein